MCSPDYEGVDKNSAVQDFLQRIEHYRVHYEPLEHELDKDLSYIQIFNQGERFMVHKLAGRSLNKRGGRLDRMVVGFIAVI